MNDSLRLARMHRLLALANEMLGIIQKTDALGDVEAKTAQAIELNLRRTRMALNNALSEQGDSSQVGSTPPQRYKE